MELQTPPSAGGGYLKFVTSDQCSNNTGLSQVRDTETTALRFHDPTVRRFDSPTVLRSYDSTTEKSFVILVRKLVVDTINNKNPTQQTGKEMETLILTSNSQKDIKLLLDIAEKLGIDLRVAEKKDLILAEADYLNKSVQPNSVSFPDIVDSCHSVRKSRYEKSQEDNS